MKQNQQLSAMTRIEGVASRDVHLSDGGVWGMARPTPRLYPRFPSILDASEAAHDECRLESRFGAPRFLDALVDRFVTSLAEADRDWQYKAFQELATCLLRMAHEISVEQAHQLLNLPGNSMAVLIGDVLELAHEYILARKPRAGGAIRAIVEDES